MKNEWPYSSSCFWPGGERQGVYDWEIFLLSRYGRKSAGACFAMIHRAARPARRIMNRTGCCGRCSSTIVRVLQPLCRQAIAAGHVRRAARESIIARKPAYAARSTILLTYSGSGLVCRREGGTGRGERNEKQVVGFIPGFLRCRL